MDAPALPLAEFAFQRVAVRPLERHAILPERSLRSADFGRAFIVGSMITHLRDEPRRLPADLVARLADNALEMLAVKRAGQRARGVPLIGIALALMPEHGAKAALTALLHARDQGGKRIAFARPLAARELLDARFDGRRIRKRRAFGQPLAHARRADAAGDEPD